VFTVHPPTGEPRGTFLYLHGGGHATEITPMHWVFIARVVLAARWTAVVPVFRIVPAATHRDVYPTLQRIYASQMAGGRDAAIVGDSSGGTLALALLQALPPERRPGRTVLLSLWLDAVLVNPDIRPLEPVDPFSTRAQLRRFAELFAGGDDLALPALSPVRGPLDHLGAIIVFAGTHDILTPDAHVLARSAGPGTSVDLREYEGRTHAWMLLGEEDRSAIADEVARVLA
jgi:acetyl esterase/lipase